MKAKLPGLSHPGYHSKRAAILRRVLDFINHDDWDELEGFMIFGKGAFDIWTGALNASKDYDDTPFRDAASKSKISRGRRAIAKRIRLGALPDDETIPEHLELMKRINPRIDIEGLSKKFRGYAVTSPPAAEIDEIDAALATEFVGLLDGSMNKMSGYDDMPVRYPSPRVQQYFDQAHRCYLYGLASASAVLCRAILESALIDKIDPQYHLRHKNSSSESHISRMIEKATGKFLDQERAKCAEEVREAGNKAIHNLPAFRAKYEKRMGEIVDNTRKIIVDLYG
jgi:hypothetical protein